MNVEWVIATWRLMCWGKFRDLIHYKDKHCFIPIQLFEDPLKFYSKFSIFFWDFKFFSQFIEDPFNLDSKPSKKLRFKILVQFIEDRFNFNSKLSKLLRIYNMNIFVILYLKVKKYEPKFAMYLLCLDTTYQKIEDMLYSQFFNLWSR